jgi:hypothetical protein
VARRKVREPRADGRTRRRPSCEIPSRHWFLPTGGDDRAVGPSAHVVQQRPTGLFRVLPRHRLGQHDRVVAGVDPLGDPADQDGQGAVQDRDRQTSNRHP